MDLVRRQMVELTGLMSLDNRVDFGKDVKLSPVVHYEKKLKGVNNENTKAAQKRGMEAHKEFKKKIEAKKDEGWITIPQALQQQII
jgi:hypothetical protein